MAEQIVILDPICDEADLCDIAPLKALDDAEVCGRMPQDESEALEKLLHLNQNYDFYKVVLADQVCAYAQVRDREGHVRELGWMFVHPDFRRRGIARSMLGRIAERSGGSTRIVAEFGDTVHPKVSPLFVQEGYSVGRGRYAYIATKRLHV